VPLTSGTPLVVVLGHQRCGAVKAAYKALKDGKGLPGHLRSVAETLRPAYEATKKGRYADPVDAMIRVHTQLSRRRQRCGPTRISLRWRRRGSWLCGQRV
jgi:carbonic anhydrase